MTLEKISEEEAENQGFEVKCLNCDSQNINIDFEKDIFWCGDCKNTAGILDYGKAHVLAIDADILHYDSRQLHEACDNVGHSANWEFFKDELETYSEDDEKTLLKALEELEE